MGFLGEKVGQDISHNLQMSCLLNKNKSCKFVEVIFWNEYRRAAGILGMIEPSRSKRPLTCPDV